MVGRGRLSGVRPIRGRNATVRPLSCRQGTRLAADALLRFEEGRATLYPDEARALTPYLRPGHRLHERRREALPLRCRARRSLYAPGERPLNTSERVTPFALHLSSITGDRCMSTREGTVRRCPFAVTDTQHSSYRQSWHSQHRANERKQLRSRARRSRRHPIAASVALPR